MIVGHLEECLFNLFAYFKIVLFLLNHRSPLYTVDTEPLCNIFSYSVTNFLLILSIFTCMHGCYISDSFTQKIAFILHTMFL